jgi:NitT/TauT family transport system ATP-binding protein
VARVTRLVVRVRRKSYPGAPRPALESLEMSAAAGEIVGIVGPSGCGKSTLLGIVAGLDRAFEGAVEVDGRPVEGAADGGAPAVRLGMMFQASRLMPWLTVLDNLRLVLGRDPAATARARRLLHDVGLEEAADTYPGRLSGGMQRRVALARAFAVEPELLLLDEPLVSLDAPTASRLRRQLVELWQGTRPAVLYVTHELREALAVADRVLFLSPGPGRVVLELPVGLARPREPGDAAVGELHDRILRQHPEILAGAADRRDPGAESAPGVAARPEP